jgi:serine/threonine protein kinase/Tol biopolymer transport system component
MTLTIAQMAAMSRLLDEALPLDAAGRRAWLDALPAEHQELAQTLREALLPDEPLQAGLEPLSPHAMAGFANLSGATRVSRLQAGARVGPYELIRALGSGGMAEVWLARRADGAFKREVALKLPMLNLLRGDLEARFARERDILASLEHPHIARFYDAGVDPNASPYLAMEYVQGQPLTEWCDAHRLSVTARLELFMQVLEALQYAHQNQVIHRDLKASNILVTDAGQVRLLDFGVAKLLEADEGDLAPLTSVYGRALTPDYASPELLYGELIDARSDIYSLGVLLYEMLTGLRPYQLRGAASIGALEQAIAAVEVKKPSAQQEVEASAARSTTPEKLARELRGDLDAIVLKALAKRPLERYQSVSALARDLRRYLDRKPIEALPARFTDRLSKYVRRNKAMVAVSATALVAILATVAFMVWGPGRQTADGVRDPLAEAKVTRLTDFAGTEQAAAISRDGRLVAFLANRDGKMDAWLTEIGSNRYRNLTEGQVHDMSNASVRTVSFSPDGGLVTLWTRSADGSRPEDIKIVGAPTAGGPLQVYLPEAAEYDWSADGKQLVYHTPGAGDPLFVRAATDTAAHQIYIAPPGIHCHFPIWSTDSEFIYFLRGEPLVHWDVWRLRPSGEGLEQITFHNTKLSYPVALDSRTLIYLATDADGSGPWLYVMDLKLKRERRISFGLERYLSLAASADGVRLVATVANSRSDLWSVRIDGNGPPPNTAAPMVPALQNAMAPRFGPGFIAYMSTGGGRRGIWKLANGAATELWNDAEADRVGAPAIAPDGRRIAFSVEKHGKTQLYVIDSDGRNARLVSAALALRGDLAWTPDSQSIVGAILQDGEPNLAKIRLDGAPPQPMTAEYSLNPVWSPDGKYLVYSGADVGMRFPLRASAPDGRPYGMASLILTRGARRVAFAPNSGSLVILRGEIAHKNFWLLNPQTGAERQLTDLPSSFVIGDFDVSPDGTEIIFDRVQDSSSIALIERAR